MAKKGIVVAIVVAGLGLVGVLGGTMALSQDATPEATGEPAAVATPEATAPAADTPTPIPTTARPAPLAGLPEGTSGRLTYFSQGELITVELPQGAEVAREAAPDVSGAVSTADGAWSATPACGATACELTIAGPEGVTASLHIDGLINGLEWPADGGALAYAAMVFDGTGALTRYDLFVVETDALERPRMLLSVPGDALLPFFWTADGDLLVANNGNNPPSIARLDRDGRGRDIATTESDVWYFYPSPDRSRVAYTQNSQEGWRLYALDVASGDVRDYGNMGSDPAGTQPPAVSPTVKGPMYIAWSPDGTYLAFGGGNEPPYTMTVVDLASGATVHTQFTEGYPGEIKWSPDSTRVAVSTYDADRTRHEVYIVDPATGASRHVSSGCVIVWSPDGRFLAQHIDREPGVAIVDVATGQYGFLTREHFDTPLRWE